MTGQRRRASPCLQLQPLCTVVPPPAAWGSRLGLGAARCRGGQAGAAGRAGPHHACSIPQLLCPGNGSQKDGWLVLEVGIRLARGQMGGKLHWGIYKTSPFNRDWEMEDPALGFQVASTSYSRTASSTTVATRSHFHLNEVTLSKMRNSVPQVH